MLSVGFAALTITAIFQKPLKKPTGAAPEILESREYTGQYLTDLSVCRVDITFSCL